MRQKEAVAAGDKWKIADANEFPGSPFQRIGSDWMLVTAGDLKDDKGNWNTMTASWGGLGILWTKKVAFVFVRHSRHTFQFVNDSPILTLSFFDDDHRNALKLCGEKSGRDIDKATASGLTPIFFTEGPSNGAVAFNEAKDILVCKKLYSQNIESSCFIEKDIIKKVYSDNDFHRMYVAEVVGYYRSLA